MTALAARFWVKVGPPDECGCRVFTGARRGDGYGAFQMGKRQTGAHRAAWEFTYGPIPSGMKVLHRCDNPPCCEPTHLFLGTNADNLADMAAKGRSTHGARNPNARLTAEEVAEIRRRRASGETCAALAREFGVQFAAVSKITTGRTWRTR